MEITQKRESRKKVNHAKTWITQKRESRKNVNHAKVWITQTCEFRKIPEQQEQERGRIVRTTLSNANTYILIVSTLFGYYK